MPKITNHIHLCFGIVLFATIAGTASSGCHLDTETTLCEMSGRRCRQGQVCTSEGLCVFRGSCGDHDTREERGEECDDGNLIDGDGCDSNCKLTSCGNSVLTLMSGEQCDDGNSIDGDGCDNNCQPTGCGNGVRTPMTGEQCDDGNRIDGDGCSGICTEEICGNGIVDEGKDEEENEQCDLGMQNSDKGSCTEDCKIATCGDGKFYEAYEECDPGIPVIPCDSNCTIPRCGNGIPANTEECDDGNLINGDTCDNNCTISRCNNGIQAGTEQCDDGNSACGTCNIDCTILASARAVGAIIIVDEDVVGTMNNSSFMINDGFGHLVNFQFERLDTPMNPSVNHIYIGQSPSVDYIRIKIEEAFVNSNLLISAQRRVGPGTDIESWI